MERVARGEVEKVLRSGIGQSFKGHAKWPNFIWLNKEAQFYSKHNQRPLKHFAKVGQTRFTTPTSSPAPHHLHCPLDINIRAPLWSQPQPGAPPQQGPPQSHVAHPPPAPFCSRALSDTGGAP